MTETPRASDEPNIARLDPSAIAEALAVRLGRTRELRGHAATLTGTSTSDDGFITVSVDSNGRLTRVLIDPKAMLYESADLAEAILLAGTDAVRDLEQQSADSTGNPQRTELTIDSAQAMLAELGTEFRQQATAASADFDQLHRRLTEGR